PTFFAACIRFLRMVCERRTSTISAPDSGMPSLTSIVSPFQHAWGRSLTWPRQAGGLSPRRRLAAFATISALSLASVCTAAEPSEPWSRILSSVGFTLGGESPRILYVGRGSQDSPLWQQNAERGAWLLIEGDSAAAASFGFRAGVESVRVANITDTHNPKL